MGTDDRRAVESGRDRAALGRVGLQRQLRDAKAQRKGWRIAPMSDEEAKQEGNMRGTVGDGREGPMDGGREGQGRDGAEQGSDRAGRVLHLTLSLTLTIILTIT